MLLDLLFKIVPNRIIKLSVAFAVLLVAITGHSALNRCAPLFGSVSPAWHEQVRRWVDDEYYDPTDLALVTRLVGAGYWTEHEGRNVVAGKYKSQDLLERLSYENQPAVSKNEMRRVETAFETRGYGDLIGRPELRPIQYKFGARRRSHVRIQEASYGADSDGETELLMFDPKSEKLIAKLKIKSDGDRRLILSDIFVVPHERLLGHAAMLVSEVLRRHPDVETVFFKVHRLEAADLKRQTGRPVSAEWILQSPMAQGAKSLGLENLRQVKNENYSETYPWTFEATVAKPKP